MGRGRAPSKAQNEALDATQVPVSVAADGVKRSDESVLGDTARAYFSFALGDDGRGVPNGANWIGTQLFPSPTRENDVIDSEEPCLRESLGGVSVDIGPTHSEESLNEAINRRVQRYPDSWGTRSFDECEGWLGTDISWPRDKCWDDGDGYLKLQPFPSPEGISGLDATQESDEEVQRMGSKFDKPSDHEDIAHLSRVDRVFRVFACLQPARNLDEELSVASRPGKGGKRPRSDDASECHEMTKETTRARDMSPLRRMETNVANEMGCVLRPKSAQDMKKPNETNMGNDEEPTLGRVSTQIATKVVDSSSCISTERAYPTIVADAALSNEVAKNEIGKSNVHSKSIGIKIRHAAPLSNKKSLTSMPVPKPFITSRQYHLNPMREASSAHGQLAKGGHHAEASYDTIDLTSEASSPSKLEAKEIGESDGHGVKMASNDTRESYKRSPHVNDASAKGNAVPINLDGAAQSSRVKFPFSAQAATGSPRHVSPSGQHPPSSPSPSPSPSGLERCSTMERNVSFTVGLQPPLCHASTSLPTDSKMTPSTNNKTAPRPQGSLNLRASSGVVRNRDGRKKGYSNPRVIPGSASTGHVMDTAYQACGGRIAEVAQRVSLLTERTISAVVLQAKPVN